MPGRTTGGFAGPVGWPAFSRKLEYHAPTLAKMDTFFGARRQPVTDAARRMALFPAGCHVIEVPPLWVPVVVCDNVYVLPGVPQLFTALVEGLPERLGQHGVIHRRLLYTPRVESTAPSWSGARPASGQVGLTSQRGQPRVCVGGGARADASSQHCSGP